MRARLVHVTDHYSAASGGVAAVVNQLSRRLAGDFDATDVVAVRGDTFPASPGVAVTNVPPSGLLKFWGSSSELKRVIGRRLSDPSTILHVHSVWMAPQYQSARLAARLRRPFVLSAHGALARFFWRSQGLPNRIKKELYWKLFARRAYGPARVLHAVTIGERDDLRALFPQNRIEVIPNAVDLDYLEEQRVKADPNPESIILFMARLHPVKGVEDLLRGFAQAKLPSTWKLVVAGPPSDAAYEASVKKLVYDLKLSASVEFIGPIYGAEKWAWLRRSWIVAVPSVSEVVGMVNLEAAGCYTPSLTTRATGLRDWEEGGGVLTERSAEAIAENLRRISTWTVSERVSRGQASYDLVWKRYSWNVVSRKWLELYASIKE
jgi:glycosyltransferase involved in cell wall biosynthesis